MTLTVVAVGVETDYPRDSGNHPLTVLESDAAGRVALGVVVALLALVA